MIIGTLTNAGERKIRQYIHVNPDHDLYIGWGFCSTSDTAAVTDSRLVNEYGRAVATVTPSAGTLTVAISELIDKGYSIMEVGIFDAASGGSMLYRGLLSEDSSTPKSRHLEDGDTLSVSIALHFAAGEFI